MPRVIAPGAFGAFGELMRDQYAALRRWQRDYGGVFQLDLGPAQFVVVADAATAAEMFLERSEEIARGGTLFEPLKAVFGQDSMLMSEGSPWRARRRAAQPYFRQRAIAAMGQRIDESIRLTLGDVATGPREIYSLCGRVAMGVGLAVLFGHDLRRDEYPPLSAAIDRAVDSIAVGWVSSRLPRWLPIPGRGRFRRSMTFIDRELDRLVRDRLEREDYGDDMLAMLLHMADAGTLSPLDLRNEAITLLIAGYDTTGNAMAWALYEIARDPAMAARIRAEVDELEPDAICQPSRLPYTTRVFKEAMRRYPSGIWLPRTANTETELGGHAIAEGTSVICSPYLVHHDPQVWTDPDRFDPERFVEDSDQPRSRFAYMPFGLGQHMCAGQHLAMLEGTTTLARVIRSWNLETVPGRPPQQRISTTMTTKDGIWVEFTPR